MVRRSLVFLCALILWATPSAASDTEGTRATLEGIRAVTVVMEPLERAVEQAGLTTAQVQTDVELRLRKAGIRVDSSATAYLYVNVNVMESNGGFAANVDVQLNQRAVLIENSLTATVATWSCGAILMTSAERASKFIPESLGELVDRFLAAYLSVNPPPPPK
jgi:hypothetical protein